MQRRSSVLCIPRTTHFKKASEGEWVVAVGVEVAAFGAGANLQRAHRLAGLQWIMTQRLATRWHSTL